MGEDLPLLYIYIYMTIATSVNISYRNVRFPQILKKI